MKGYKHKIGVTLVEILIVVAVIAILATMVAGIATRISNQSKEQLTKNTFALLNAALGQFRDFGYNYNPGTLDPAVKDFYRGLDFPLDCNGFDKAGLEQALASALGLPPAPATVNIMPPVALRDPNYSGSEMLYFFLSRVPASQQTLEKIDKSLITNLSVDKQPMEIHITFTGPGGLKIFPLARIIDPWGTTLHYDYYDERDPDPVRRDKRKRNFPEITSAGPDRIFGTGDDISNR